MPLKNMHVKPFRSGRLRDFIVYIAISVLCCVLVMFLATRDIPKDQIMGWIGFIVFTSLTFGFFVEKSKYAWGKRLFWILTGTVISIHSIAFTRLLVLGNSIPLSRFILVSLFEMAFLVVVRNVVFGYKLSPSASSPR